MTDSELEQRKARAANETLVIAPTEGGFRVYNPASITHIYMVTGIADLPQCNCPDFENHKSDPDWRCKHIIAVLNQNDKRCAPSEANASQSASESKPESKPNNLGEKKKAKSIRNAQHSQLVLKRSVSPDGRIDSLSVEFSNPIGADSDDEIKKRAAKALNLQTVIVQEFLNQNGNRQAADEPKSNPTASKSPTSANTSSTPQPGKNLEGGVVAQLLNIAGMNTRSGWRLFINVQVNGTTVKLFGSKRELSDYVVASGFANIADCIEQGVTLNLPCRVITKPSPDGRYTNIERVLPIKPLEEKGRNGQ